MSDLQREHALLKDKYIALCKDMEKRGGRIFGNVCNGYAKEAAYEAQLLAQKALDCRLQFEMRSEVLTPERYDLASLPNPNDSNEQE